MDLNTLIKFGYPETLIKEYKNWYLLLRTKQTTLGSLVLICKDKVEKYSEISEESFGEFEIIIKEVEKYLYNYFEYCKINYLMLMMVDKNVHYHIIPRYANIKNIFYQEFMDFGWPGAPDLKKYNKTDYKTFEKLKELLKKGFTNGVEKKKPYNIIYTTGSFDIFHQGHLNILEKSKELCNYLLVGVSTDELIEKVKGKTPIIPFKERMRIVSSIKYVDEVIPQYDKNKQKIVDKYNVDAITVGDDWKGRYPEVSCEIIYFPYTQGISSSKIKESFKLNNIK